MPSLPRPIGREHVLQTCTPLARCTLIMGPPSTGKRTCVEYLAVEQGMRAMDVRLFPESYWFTLPSGKQRYVEPELTTKVVRELLRWARTGAPRSSAGRLAVVRLDHRRVDGTVWTAPRSAQHALLKLCEEPPEGLRLVLLCTAAPLETLVSRSRVVISGLLAAPDLAEILYRVSDLDRPSSLAAANLGSGRVAPALESASGVERSLDIVRGALAELAAGDHAALALRAGGRSWDDTCVRLLRLFAHEAITRRGSVFTDAERTRFSPSQAMAMLRALAAVEGASPRLQLGALASMSK